MCAGDAHRPGFALVWPFEQFDYRAASGDLVIEHNDVAAADIADNRADLNPVIAVTLLGTGRYCGTEQPG